MLQKTIRLFSWKEIDDNIEIFRKAFDAGVPFICGSESGFSVTPYGDYTIKN